MMELGFYMNEMGLFQVSLRKAGSIIILCIFLSSIAWVGSLSLTFFDNDEPDSNENDDPSEGEWFTVKETSMNHFNITVHDTPLGKTILSCSPSGAEYGNRLNPSYKPLVESLYKPFPGEIDLDTFDPENYDEDNLPHNAYGSTIITGRDPVYFQFSKVLHNSSIRCSLYDQGEDNPYVQEVVLQIPLVSGNHQQIVNVSMTKDWDGLTLHFERPTTTSWYSTSMIFLNGCDYSTSEVIVDTNQEGDDLVSNSDYIGAVDEGTWIITVFGAEQDGYIEHITWYQFDYDGNDCDYPDSCETQVEVTPYATYNWLL